eukprot:5269311-Alexandrium_andersonii.AAC.1
MSASLVGSEMCIRDSTNFSSLLPPTPSKLPRPFHPLGAQRDQATPSPKSCLLYTSDAADDM